LHGKAPNVAGEIFICHKTVQLFAAGRLEHARYSKAISQTHSKEIQVGRTKAAFDGLVHVAANDADFLVLEHAGTPVLALDITTGDLRGFLIYASDGWESFFVPVAYRSDEECCSSR